MIKTLDEALSAIAERTYENTMDIRQKNRQRRHQVVDVYGVEYTRLGDNGFPAKFYISISPDMVYLERFEFKLIIQPFVSTSSGVGNTELTLNTIATVSGTTLELHDDVVTPDPHTHSLTSGIGLTHTTASDFTVSIDGVDVTPYLMAQYGEWISGEGVYPSLEIGQDYDVLEVASDLMAEGNETDANKLTSPGYKLIQISSSGPFQVTLVNYLKYSHLNR